MTADTDQFVWADVIEILEAAGWVDVSRAAGPAMLNGPLPYQFAVIHPGRGYTEIELTLDHRCSMFVFASNVPAVRIARALIALTEPIPD